MKKKIIALSMVSFTLSTVGCSKISQGNGLAVIDKVQDKKLFTNMYGVEVNGGRYLNNDLGLVILCVSGEENEISMTITKKNINERMFQDQVRLALESLNGSQKEVAVTKEVLEKGMEQAYYKKHPDKSSLHNEDGVILILNNDKFKVRAMVGDVGSEEGDIKISIKSKSDISDYLKISGLHFEDYYYEGKEDVEIREYILSEETSGVEIKCKKEDLKNGSRLISAMEEYANLDKKDMEKVRSYIISEEGVSGYKEVLKNKKTLILGKSIAKDDMVSIFIGKGDLDKLNNELKC